MNKKVKVYFLFLMKIKHHSNSHLKNSHFLIVKNKKKKGTLHQKMKFSIKDFVSKCDQIRSFLQIWSHLLKKSLMKNFIFCAVEIAHQSHSRFKNQVYCLEKNAKTNRIIPNYINITVIDRYLWMSRYKLF